MLYGCGTWSLTLREESRLRVFENRILRRIFGPKKDENGEWRRLYNQKKSGCRSTFKILAGKPTVKRPLGRPRRRWVNHIIMDLIEIGINMRNWVSLAQDGDYWRALANMALNLLFP